MFGPLTVGKKAAKFGYKRYGIPGAVAAGSTGVLGYLVVRRAVKSVVKRKDVSGVVDAGTIQSAVEADGLGAITDRKTLESAIDEDQLGTPIDVEEVQSVTEEETDEMDDVQDDGTNTAEGDDGTNTDTNSNSADQ